MMRRDAMRSKLYVHGRPASERVGSGFRAKRVEHDITHLGPARSGPFRPFSLSRCVGFVDGAILRLCSFKPNVIT